MSDRRFVVVPVDEDVVAELFDWQRRGSVRLPVFEGLPAGYRIEGVVHDFTRQAFLFRVHHPSLPEVPPDVVEPPVGGTVGYREFPAKGAGAVTSGSAKPANFQWEFLGPPPVDDRSRPVG